MNQITSIYNRLKELDKSVGVWHSPFGNYGTKETGLWNKNPKTEMPNNTAEYRSLITQLKILLNGKRN